MSADFSEVDDLAAQLLGAQERAIEGTLDALEEAGQEMADYQRDHAPADRTGQTRGTIDWELAEDGWAVVAGTKTWYAIYIEGGTTTMAPRPFVAPSLPEVMPKFLRALAKHGADLFR